MLMKLEVLEIILLKIKQEGNQHSVISREQLCKRHVRMPRKMEMKGELEMIDLWKDQY